MVTTHKSSSSPSARHSEPRREPRTRLAARRVPARARLACSAALVLLLVGLTAAAHAQGIRIGYLDMKRIFDNAPQVVDAREALDHEFRPRNEALIADEDRVVRLEDELAASGNISADERLEREREIRNSRRAIERRREDLREELRFRTNAITKAFEETIEIAVRQVAEAGGYDLVLTSPVAYASDSIDITELILDWLVDDFASQ